MSNKSHEIEAEADAIELELPHASGVAFSTAHAEALQVGLDVMQIENGVLYRVSPDGSRVVVKEVSPPIEVEQGKRYYLP